MPPDQNDTDQHQTFAPPRSGRWLELLLQYRYAVVIALVLLFVLSQKAMAQEFKSAADCLVGKRAATREKQPGLTVKADDASFYNTTCSKKA